MSSQRARMMLGAVFVLVVAGTVAALAVHRRARPLLTNPQFRQNIRVWVHDNDIRPGVINAWPGHMTSMTYPSGRTVNNGFDGAGRLQTFTGNLGDGTLRTYASGITYSSFGGMTREQYGTTTPLYNKTFYNIRGQMFDRRVSSVNDTWDWNRGRLIWYYSSNHVWGGSGTDNNGNVVYAENWIPQPNQTGDQGQYLFADTYTYDSLNRLSGDYESSLDLANNGSWQSRFAQVYNYDRYGNRTINGGSTWGTGINNAQSWIDASNNRLYAPSDQNVSDPEQRLIRYDAAGNQKADYYSATGQGTRTYDAENRMKTATDTSNNTSTYVYDGDGHRIKRIVGSVETWQVYGLGGELIAEYAANTAASSPQKEYGYRNGELLITATVTAGWGAAPTLTDNPLQVGVTVVKAQHITELRTAINAVRSHYNLSAYSWQYSATTNDYISANPILEMRAALDQALGAGNYASGLAQGQPVKAIHIQELRDRILAAWQGSGGSVDIRWLVADQLGTPRMIFDQSGSLANVSRHDYLPFGEELGAGVGGRTPQQGYSASDGVRQHFSQKERDSETGLDYFGARYYASMQGRFVSADPLFIELNRLSDPQQLNLYQYTRNNPLKFRDPTGLDITVHGCEQEQYMKRLQNLVSFNVKLVFNANKNLQVQIVDAKGNALSEKELKALGKSLKGGEKELFNAITDTKNHVTIDTGNGLANSRIFFGDGKSNSGGTNKLDFTDINLLDDPKNAGGFSSSQVIGHETLEAYAKSKGDSFDDAHAYANQFFGGLEQPTTPGTSHFDAQNANLISVTADFPVHGGGGVNARITLQFVTPIPVQAIPTTKPGTQLANVVSVEKH